MIVYWILLSILFLLVLGTVTNISEHSKNILFWGCATTLIVLSSVRSFEVGVDTLNYCNGFEYIQRLSFKQAMLFGWEQGYVAVNWILSRFFSDKRALIIFMAFAILLPIFSWMKKESEWPMLSLLVFVCIGMWSSSMFILRQWCAMAILTYSYKYIKQKKFFRFLIIVLIAAMFHHTAVIFLLAYFVYRIPINKVTVILAVPASMIIGLFGGRILSFLNQFARNAEAGNYNGGLSMLAVLWLCVIAVLACFKGTVPERLDFYFRLVFLAAFLQPIAFTFSDWSRIVAYFSVSLSIFLPNFVMELTSNRSKNHQLLLPLGVTVCVLMLVWFGMTQPEPYIFMWS
ncbi:EpsG family protein [Limosilactobacillus fermentum]